MWHYFVAHVVYYMTRCFPNERRGPVRFFCLFVALMFLIPQFVVLFLKESERYCKNPLLDVLVTTIVTTFAMLGFSFLFAMMEPVPWKLKIAFHFFGAFSFLIGILQFSYAVGATECSQTATQLYYLSISFGIFGLVTAVFFMCLLPFWVIEFFWKGTVYNKPERRGMCYEQVCQTSTSCTKNQFASFLTQGKQTCVDCFCNGLNVPCRRAMHYTSLIDLKDDVTKVKVSDDRSRLINNGLYFNSDHEVILGNVPELQSSSLYWRLPKKFCGNQVRSYGGFLSYSIFYDVWSSGKFYQGYDVKIMGSNGIGLQYKNTLRIKPKLTHSIKVEMAEGMLTLKNGVKATRKEIMKVLLSIESVLIRATYTSDTKLTILSSVSMETAIPYFTRHAIAQRVEQCSCPEGYSGLSCETCRRGYTRSRVPGKEANCIRCQCNRHTLECHQETGVCKNCKHNTVGLYCEKCQPGYYGNAEIGTTEDCRKCACPLSIASNQFSSTCHISRSGALKCDACHRGYTGNQCGECAIGYSGNPRIAGGKCASVTKITQKTPSVRITPRRRVDPIGFRATFRCGIKGAAPYFVTWSRRDARPLPRGRYRVLTRKGTRVLVISSLVIEDEGDYVCTARNRYGVSSKKVWMNIYERKVFPIEVSVSPKSLRISEGSSALFLCSVSWNPVTHTRSWSREGYRLLPPTAKAHDGTLIFKNARKSDSGVYTCTASNQVTVASTTVVLSVGAVIKPQISLWPIRQTVTVGETATFYCSASGFPRPEVFWSRQQMLAKYAKSIDIEDYYINSEGVMKINSVRVEDEGQYSCTASNVAGKTTRRAMLYVKAPGRSLSVSVFPKVHKTKIGDSVAFTCVASGRPLPVVSWTILNGKMPSSATIRNGVLTITVASLNDSGIYLCTAKNPYGAASAKVKLKVYERISPLKVTLQPHILKLSEGGSAQLVCNISGDVSVITWSKSDGVLSINHAVHDGNILNITNANAKDEGKYFCTASNNEGFAQASATVTITRKDPPQITIFPATKRVTEIGDKVHFRCTVTQGKPIRSIAWYNSDGSLILGRDGRQTSQVDELLLQFDKVEKKDAGDYICTAKNEHGYARATTVLDVSGKPKIKLRPRGTYHAVTGDDVMFECESSGYPVPNVGWVLPTSAEALGASLSSWPGYGRIQMKARKEVSGTYHCNASNEEGISYDSVIVSVTNQTEKPAVVVSPTIVKAIVGQRVEIKCEQFGVPSPEFIWVKLRRNAKSLVVSSDAIFVIDDMRMSDAGSYACRAWNRLGIAQANAEIIVSVPPTVIASPHSVTVLGGRSFSLDCQTRQGLPKPSITWTRPGRQDLPGDSSVVNGTLHVINAKFEDAGVYECVAQNRGGNATAAINVTVLVPPRIFTSPLKEQTVNLGHDVTFHCNASGHPVPTITWYKNKDLISHSSHDGQLRLSNVTSTSHGQYKCRAGNLAGFAEEIFSLAIEEVPTVSIKDKTGTSMKVVPVGRNLTLTCLATGTPEPIIQWTKIVGKLPDGYNIQDGTLTIIRAKVTDAGTFRCSVFNSVGHVHAEIRVFVQGAPTVKVTPKSIKKQVGQEARITCAVTGMPVPTVSWHKLAGRLPPNFVESGVLILPKVKKEDRGDYICRAVNSEGSAEDSAKLHTTDFLPRFFEDGQSYVIFGKILGALYRTTIEISFRAENENGLLLYNGRLNEDFISVGIMKGYIVFQYNLGSGPAFIKSSAAVTLFEWHTVQVSRDGLHGTLIVDDQPMLYGRSKGKYTGLNLVGDLFVGGHANLDVIKRQTKHGRGFTGCISQLVISGKSLEIGEFVFILYFIIMMTGTRSGPRVLTIGYNLAGISLTHENATH
eukprot:gene15275-16851_t